MKASDKFFSAAVVILVVLLIAMIEVAVATAVDSYKSVSKAEVVVNPIQQRFQAVMTDTQSGLRVFADTETNVMYLSRYSAGGICVMVDADGNPLLWDGGKTQ